jgi:hypothetical protein
LRLGLLEIKLPRRLRLERRRTGSAVDILKHWNTMPTGVTDLPHPFLVSLLFFLFFSLGSSSASTLALLTLLGIKKISSSL